PRDGDVEARQERDERHDERVHVLLAVDPSRRRPFAQDAVSPPPAAAKNSRNLRKYVFVTCAVSSLRYLASSCTKPRVYTKAGSSENASASMARRWLIEIFVARAMSSMLMPRDSRTLPSRAPVNSVSAFSSRASSRCIISRSASSAASIT